MSSLLKKEQFYNSVICRLNVSVLEWRTGMLEVVFSDSAKGAMCVAQHCGNGDLSEAVGFSIISSEPLSPEEEKRRLKKAKQEWLGRHRSAIPLGGSSEDVFGLSFELSIGDIAAPLESGPRKDFIFQWITAGLWGDIDESKASAENYWKGCVNDLENLKQRAKAGEPVRIWYDYSPDGMCGLLFTAFQLKEASGHISAICLPLWEKIKNAIVQYTSWAEIAPEKLGRYLALEKELTPIMRNILAMWWSQLQEDNAPLRAIVNGRLLSVDEQFYDGLIMCAVPNGDFTIGSLIGIVMGKYQLGIGDWLISQRIHNMIKEGVFRVVKKDNRPYATILCKHVPI